MKFIRCRPLARIAAFTLVETSISLAVLSVFLTFAYAAMLISNRQAMVHRLYTLAEEMARDQVDRVASASPFNPQFANPQIPAVLALDSTRGNQPAVQVLPLYTDPANGATVVNATMSTSVTDTGTLNTRAALVTVSYNFAGRPYVVRMNTFRTSDS